MRNNQKITRVQLNIDQNEEVILIGIVSADPDYKLSLALNRKFGISLKNISPLLVSDDTLAELNFSRFSDISKSPDIVYTLNSNRSGSNFLIKKLKNVDYIFHIQYPEKESIIKKITAGLREMESVNAIFNIDINNIKDKNLQLVIQ
jgi:hypothetical protein